jgi:hypothetical protein
MKIGKLYDAFKYLVVGLLCLFIAGFIYSSLQEVSAERRLVDSLEAIPNYNYVPDIRTLKADRKLSEALEMARFVIRHTDMPGQDEAKALEKELEEELTSWWGRAKRVASGFVKGKGNSIEELSGGIASDMIIWGDIRDLVKQGYFKVTGKETDPVIAALAGIGLLTEAVDMIDWAPAVLKAFRKIGALSRKFADFVLTACKKSAKGGKLDGTLKVAFRNLQTLTDKMGLARTAAIFKHVDDPADLAAISIVAQKNVDAAYFTVKNGGTDGIILVKRLGNSDAGVATMAMVAKKGPAGIQWLKRGGDGYQHVLKVRFGTRFFKNLRLHRPQQLIKEIAKKYPGLLKALWGITFLALAGSLFSFIESGRKIIDIAANGKTSP